MQQPRIQQNDRRGMALITVMLLLLVFMLLVGALLSFLPAELRQVAFSGYDNRALYVADAGIQAAVVKIDETAPAIYKGPLNESFLAEPDGTRGSYTVTVKSMKTVSGLRSYWLDSFGVAPTGEHRRVDAVVLEQSFAHWNYIGKNNAPGNFFVAGLMQFNGPVYLEGQSASSPVNLQYYNNVPALFLDTVTIAGNYQWYDQSNNNNAPSGSQWNSVDAGGQPSVSFKGPNAVAFPPDTSSTLVANEALNGQPGTTAQSENKAGVYLNQTSTDKLKSGDPLSTGIFVQGDANITMAASNPGVSPSTQTFIFSPPGTPNGIPQAVTVVINFTTNQTTVNGKSGAVTFSGVPNGDGSDTNGANGAIFVNGDISGISGSVNGQYTIAVPDTVAAQNNITVAGNIVYHQDPRSCNCSSTDMLGLFANDVKVSTSAISGAVSIEAAIFAGSQSEVTSKSTDGTFETDSSNVCSVSAKGNLNVYGSLANNFVSPLGCFDPGSGKLTGGWADNYTWDTRFKTASPPFYPRSPAYGVVAWKDIGTQ